MENWLGNWNAAGKLFLAFAVVIGLNVVIGFLCLQTSAPVHQADENPAMDPISSVRTLTDLRWSLGIHQQAQLEFLLARTEAERQDSEKRLRAATVRVLASRGAYSSSSLQPQEARFKGEIDGVLKRYLAVSQQVIDLAHLSQHKTTGERSSKRRSRKRRSKSERLALELFYGPEGAALAKAYAVLQTAVEQEIRLAVVPSRAPSQAGAAPRGSMRHQEALGIAISAGIGLLLGLVVSLLVTRPMRQLRVVVRKIAAGDLNDEIAASIGNEEAGEVGQCLIDLQTGLREMMGAAGGCAQRVAQASETISLANRRQGGGADAVHCAQEVANAIQQVMGAVKEISERSGLAAVAACQSVATAGKAGAFLDPVPAQVGAIGAALSQTAKRIQDLKKSGEQIAQVVSVIGDIANETKLLSLNAALEATRAGDKGRGFSVVSEEVAKLAERTTRATGEIELLVTLMQGGHKSAASAIHQVTSQTEVVLGTTRQAADLSRSTLTESRMLADMVAAVSTTASQQIGAGDYIFPRLERISKINAESWESAQCSIIATAEISVVAVELQNLITRLNNSGKRNSADDFARSLPEWARHPDSLISGATISGSISGPGEHAHNVVPLAARDGINPGRARIHARLVTPETNPESQSRAPSVAS